VYRACNLLVHKHGRVTAIRRWGWEGGGDGKRCFRPTYQKGIFNLSWCHSINKKSGGEYEGGGGRQMVHEVKTTDMGMGKGNREKGRWCCLRKIMEVKNGIITYW
jgi:hypothetical protein